MHALISTLIQNYQPGGDIREDMAAFLILHSCPNTAAHCQEVGDRAAGLAPRFGVDAVQAGLAGWLHDVSAVFPNRQRLETAQLLGIEILPEEAEVPLLLHQKLSAVLAEEVFGVSDAGVLSAITCHTTLKANPSVLDMLVFVADKLAWDQKGEPPYKPDLQAALARSLEEAAWVYQNYLYHSGKAKVLHPWMLASYRELAAKFPGN